MTRGRRNALPSPMVLLCALCLAAAFPSSPARAQNVDNTVVPDFYSVPFGYSYMGPASSESPSSGFLWKPICHGGGPLVILFPSKTQSRITKMGLFKEFPIVEQQAIEWGRYSGDYHDDRPIFRFNKFGADYSAPLFVIIRLTDNWEYGYHIPDTSARTEHVVPWRAYYVGAEDPAPPLTGMDSTQDWAPPPDLVDSWGTEPDISDPVDQSTAPAHAPRAVGHRSGPEPGATSGGEEPRLDGRVPAHEGAPGEGGTPLEGSGLTQESPEEVQYGSKPAADAPDPEEDDEGEEYELVPE